MGIIVDIIICVIILGNAIIGYKKGLVDVVFNICSSIVAFILVMILYMPATNYIAENTKFSEKIEGVVEQKIQDIFGDQEVNAQDIVNLQETEEYGDLINVFFGQEIGNVLQKASGSVVNYLSVQLTRKVISVIVFFVLYTVIKILLYLLKSYADLIAKLPFIRLFNCSGGMIYGIIKGFLIIYVLFAIIYIIMPMINNVAILEAIENAPIGSKIFNNNILLNIIFKFL